MANPPAKPPPAPAAPIPVVTNDGKVGYLPAALADDASVVAGLHRASDQQLREAQLQANDDATREALEAQYGGTVEGAVGPVLAGAARGLTLGGSDVALSSIPSVRKKLLDYQTFSPIGSTVGELGAIAGASLLGDEASLADIPALVGKLGARAGGAVTEGLGGGLVARGAGALVRGGLEGAIYGEGKLASDSALHNEDITAERVIASGVHGAEMGALMGGGLHLAGEAAGAVGSRVTRSAAPALEGAAEAGGTAESSSLGEALQKGADVKTIKALGGSAGDLRALEDNVQGGYQKVAQDIRGDIEQSTGKSIGFHNRESLHEYATKRVEELGNQLGGMLKKLDENGAIAPDMQGFASRVRDELVAPNVVIAPNEKGILEMVPKPGMRGPVDAVEGWLKDIDASYGNKPPTFTEWQQARRALDKQINFAARNASPEMEALRDLRGMMEKELETSGEAAAKNMGGSFVDQYQATKSLYQSVRKAEELTARGVSRELVNNSVGLNAVIGAGAGLAAGGPLGGIAMGVAGKIIKDRGDQMAADLLSRAADIAGVAKVAARTDARIAAGASKLTGKALPAGELAGPKASGGGFFSTLLDRAGTSARTTAIEGASTKAVGRAADFNRRVEALANLQANPAQLSAHVGEMLGPVATASPKVAGVATMKAMTGLAFLQSKLPPSRQDPYTLQPQFQPPSRPSATEIAVHTRYVEALDDPTIILKRAANGTLTAEHVEAVQAVYPKLYAQMRSEIFTGMVNSKAKVPYGRRIQLGTLLDLPTDASLAPEFVQAIQASYTSQPEASTQAPPSPQLSSLDVASSFETGSQAVSGGAER